MRVQKPILVAGAVASVGIAGLTGLGAVHAASSTSGNDSLVDKIATKFNLNKDDVQAVFDQNRTEHEAEHQADQQKYLQRLVDDGKITANQKTLIENKQKELKTAMETQMKDLKSWADSNHIDMKYLMGGMRAADNGALQQLVDDGKITADQKTLIENKQKELKSVRDTAKTALDKWASDNGIDTKYLMGFHGHGFGGPGGHGLSDQQ